MNDNWAEVRRQMEEVLELERAQRQARRQQSSFGQSLGQWLPSAVWLGRVQRPSPSSSAYSASPPLDERSEK
jgi:hypothetical protein